ncbi:uncharacterized protein LOC111886317 [Lactuca sativa]|uniref:uncharacterized protein LOC111886317 n=1 Tax=Lactuca sativa TaxID=4236 RepID=UPI000CD8902A|nr:uncharacterized protein LOC111886317 [Lactuca sativa]
MAMAEKRPRINWKQIEGVEKTFLEACIHEITTYRREGSSLKASSWKNVAERLKTEYNFVVDQKQMKNRYDYLKAKFGAWLKLKNKIGNLNKMVETLRTSPLVYPDLCVQLFDGSAATGIHGWGASSTLPHPSHDSPDINLSDFDGINVIYGYR